MQVPLYMSSRELLKHFGVKHTDGYRYVPADVIQRILSGQMNEQPEIIEFDLGL